MRKRLLIALGATAALVVAATAYAAFTASGISDHRRDADDDDGDRCQDPPVHRRGRQGVHDHGRASSPAPPTSRSRQPISTARATFHVKTTVDDASHLGYVEGSFKVKDADTDFHGRFVGTLDAAGQVRRLPHGRRPSRQQGEGPRHAERHVRGRPRASRPGRSARNRSASAALAVIAGPVCKKAKEPKPPKPNPPAPHNKRFDIHGTISAIGGSPVSASPYVGKGPTTAMCTVDGSSPSTTGFAVNDKVKMKCEQVSGTTRGTSGS